VGGPGYGGRSAAVSVALTILRALLRSATLVVVAVGVAFLVERFLPRIQQDPRPWLDQLADWVRGPWETRTGPAILRAIPWTVAIVGTGTLIAVVVGTLTGAWLARPGRSGRTRAAWLPILLAACTPAWIIGLLLVALLGVWARILPTGNAISPLQRWADPVEIALDLAAHAVLPIASLALAGIGTFAVSMRALVTSEAGTDYTTYGESLGLAPRSRFLRWEVRPALGPQLTAAALALGTIVTGVFFVEAVFSYPGLGWLFVHAMLNYDFPTVRGVLFLLVLGVALVTFVIDLALPLVDPRVRRSRG